MARASRPCQNSGLTHFPKLNVVGSIPITRSNPLILRQVQRLPTRSG